MVLKRAEDRVEIKEDEDDESPVEMEDDATTSEGGDDTRIIPLDDQKTVSFRQPPKRKVPKKRRLTKRELTEKLKEKQERDRMCLVKPDVVRDRTKERELRRIATLGVAQLFNAVSTRQKILDKEIERQKALMGTIKNKEKLRPHLNLGSVSEFKPKKEEVENWLNDSSAKDTSIVKEEVEIQE